MTFELDPLPYEVAALEPYMSARTLDVHYNKHHASYFEKLQSAVKGTRWAGLELCEIVRQADDLDLFRNAAQTWNHMFFWNCMRPAETRERSPSGALKEQVERDLGGIDSFHKEFAEAASGEFGSGWAWLVLDASGCLQVISTSDADNPMRHSQYPILTLDVWEHAYYLDYQNERGKYIESFLDHLIDWSFAERNFERNGRA